MRCKQRQSGQNTQPEGHRAAPGRRTGTDWRPGNGHHYWQGIEKGDYDPGRQEKPAPADGMGGTTHQRNHPRAHD